MAQKFTLNVNGKAHSVEADPDMPLLYALRDDIGLNNPRFGCGLAQCGACTVHMDGQAIRSCITPVSSVGDAKIVTLAGLGTPDKPHPLQTAYVEEQVPQCGYCINGWIMTAASFLATKKKPTEAEIKTALEGVKCRCGTHVSILKAVKRAAAGKARSDTTQRTIEEITARVEESVQTFQQIVASTNQQQLGIEQVMGALQNIRQASQQTAAGTREVEAASANLTELAQALMTLAERYRH